MYATMVERFSPAWPYRGYVRCLACPGSWRDHDGWRDRYQWRDHDRWHDHYRWRDHDGWRRHYGGWPYGGWGGGGGGGNKPRVLPLPPPLKGVCPLKKPFFQGAPPPFFP